MNEKYQMEIDNFKKRFQNYHNARIVLYGIGRYTITLLEGIEGFHIVGLMDKDPNNIGKRLMGIPIIGKDRVEAIADLIIINTSETYWSVIYNRICDINIPIYYINGKKAEKERIYQVENPFSDLSYYKLLEKIKKSEIISFDFFDTLFMRSVCAPRDLFELMGLQLDFPFLHLRNMAKKQVEENYALDELYERIEMLGGISHQLIDVIKNNEILLEKKLLIPREPILSCLKKLVDQRREVYIISDMYLPKEFYCEILKEYGINISEKAILVSNKLRKNKYDGTMWEYYQKNIVKGRQALHIGDNQIADIEKPKEYGIATYQVPSVWKMLLHSSLKDIASKVCNLYDSSIVGCILSKLFKNPYKNNLSNGMITITNNYDMGYCVFGPVIMTFLFWLLKQSKEDKIKKLIFMSRDGYFLKEDFDYFCNLIGEKRETCYLGISRQLAMMVSIETENDLLEYASMPYSGSIKEMFEDRFGINDINYEKGKLLEDYIKENILEIKNKISKIKSNYKKYIKKFELNQNCAIVDIGYYGNNQKYLNKFLKIKMSGYYFNANLSEKNKNVRDQKMTVCFQSAKDVLGEASQILKKQIFLESFLTASYGMVKAIDENGNFICDSNKRNQEYFYEKKEINSGVKEYIFDYIDKFNKFNIELNIEFIDWYYGNCFNNTMKYTENVKRSFYNDNAMMNRIESMLFY